MNFQNKIVLLTGASRGLGLCLAEKLSKLGAIVIGIYNKNKIELENVDAYNCNLLKEEEINKLFKYIQEKYQNIDYVINCAAIDMPNDVFDKTKEEFMNVLEVNLIVPFLICQKAIPLMDGGVIVNISSTDASNTYNPINMDYAASKSGLENLTKNLALKFPKLKICAIAPNWIATESVLEMSPIYLEEELKRLNQKRLLTKEEVSDKIIEIIISNNIKSGEIVRMDGQDV